MPGNSRSQPLEQMVPPDEPRIMQYSFSILISTLSFWKGVFFFCKSLFCFIPLEIRILSF
ncbi:MAG: hypothetical protein BHV72_00875 [Bacteroides sp. 43_46]|nr:MAG: hypothetical protein BHV72_00875 [Bacteroides sp. 43_46]